MQKLNTSQDMAVDVSKRITDWDFSNYPAKASGLDIFSRQGNIAPPLPTSPAPFGKASGWLDIANAMDERQERKRSLGYLGSNSSGAGRREPSGRHPPSLSENSVQVL